MSSNSLSLVIGVRSVIINLFWLVAYDAMYIILAISDCVNMLLSMLSCLHAL